MKGWAILTILLYIGFLIVLAFTLPPLAMDSYTNPLKEVAFWIFTGVMILSQILLLVTKVSISGEIKLKKRHILIPVGTASFLLALLVVGLIVSLIVAIFGDKGGQFIGWVAIAVVVLSWVFWFWRFKRFSKTDPESLLDKITTTLIKYSVLELLVAISCHIVVRKRGDCSAPVGTFYGIATGIAVMFLAFGPGIFCLLAKRRQQMLPKSKRGS